MKKREKLAVLFGLMADGFPDPSELGPEIRALIGLPVCNDDGGCSREDVKIGVAETLAELLAGEEEGR